ncbi:MAG: hypothetical protein HY262_04370 [Chloroflexi bacterium]|nr:hypothetical protein [Chloroflexota bacterium]
MTELDAETLLCSMLERDGARVRRQVPFGGKRLDVAARFPKSGEEWISVEVKLRDWKKAVEQAAINRLFFARSFIAVPAALAGPVNEEYLRARGVGLIKFDADDWWVDLEAESTVMSDSLVCSMNEKLA